MGVLDTVKVFLGASLSRFSTTLGWNESSSSLNVTLVEDDGQVFLPRLNGNENYVGKPFYFDYGELKFGGILQSWKQENSTASYPSYNLTLTDPRDILDGTQVIVDQFQLTGDYDQEYFRANMPGIFNVYDFLETAPYGSFGRSLVNEMGMLWFLIRDSILNIQEIYGPLRYMGENYYFDFTGLPTPPLDYRIPGPNFSIIEMISTLCSDCGCDFYCYLEYENGRNTIKFKNVSRTTQPVLGQIKVYINSKTNVEDTNKTVTNFSQGLEFRNEQISTLLLGGNREDLYFINDLNDKIRPFFGFDVNNHAITATSMTDEGEVVLNSSPIADIGGVYYPCYLIELRAALYNMETWIAAIHRFNPNVAALLGFDINAWADALEALATELSTDSTISTKLVTTTNSFKNIAGKMANGDDFAVKINRVYEWIKGVAQEYYGKKFAISLPNVNYRVDGDTGQVTFEYDIADTGFLPPTSAEGIIGLDKNNEPIFTDDQGKFYAIARFDNVFNKDLREIGDEFVLEDNGNTLFVKIDVEPYLVNPTRNPFGGTCCVITVPTTISDVPQTALGDASALATLLGLSEAEIAQYKKADANAFYVKVPYAIPPVPIEPTMVGIPLKSNVYSYGPWTTPGYAPGGKVRFERDESITPWVFGGYSEMNAYAEAKIANSYSGMTIGELGTITEAGAPTIQLGDILKAGGPILTGMSVDTGPGGVTTTYEMRTYTPRFGTFSLQNAERIRRFSLRAATARKVQRELLKRNSARALAYRAYSQGFMKDIAGFAKRTGGTPHEGLCAYVDDKTDTRKETTVASDIATHFVGKLRGNSLKGDENSELDKMGVLGMEGLFRPYQTDYDAETTYLPKFTRPTSSGVGNPNVDDLNPLKEGHDINLVLSRNPDGSYKDYVLQGTNEGYHSGLQPIAFKAPMVLAGWGYDINGNPVPSSAPNQFLDNYLTKPETWKVGPVDFRWDESKGVWVTGGSVIKLVKLVQPLIQYGNSAAAVELTPNLDNYNKKSFNFIGPPSGWYKESQKAIRITNFYRFSTLPSGMRCMVASCNSINYIISAEG